MSYYPATSGPGNLDAAAIVHPKQASGVKQFGREGMAKISSQERHQYFEKIKPYREMIGGILTQEKNRLVLIKQNTESAAFIRFTLSEAMLNLTSYYIVLSGLSWAMLKVKNEEALNKGRKAVYKSVIYLEEVVTNYVDAPFSDYENKLAEIATVDAARRYLFIRKMGLTIQLLENAYGDNTKWRWAFVELEGRFAAVAKNILDLKNAMVNTDPRFPYYEPTVYHLRLIKKLLAQAADRYREKYELSTNRVDDFQLGISFLYALQRLHVMTNDRDEAEMVKKRLETWSAKLEGDLKRRLKS
jgi:hypothetical protein